MSSPDLRSFLHDARQAGLVDDIDSPHSSVYQIARHIFESPARVQHFHQVENYPHCSLLANLVANRQLLALGLNVDDDALNQRVQQALANPGVIREVDDAAFLAKRHHKPDLKSLVPMQRFYAEKKRDYTTASIIIARHPEHGLNMSYHRMMLLEGNRMVVRVVPRHLRQILDLDDGRAEVLVATGLHPALGFAASLSFGPDFDELACAAGLMDTELDCLRIGDLLVPAGAEMVWRAHFTGELADEGPFVDLTGTYDGIRQQPVLEVDELMHRDNYIFQTILPGGVEHKLLMGMPQEPRMFRIVNNTVPGLRDLSLTEGGSGWLHAVLSIEQRVPGQGKNAGLAALAAHPSLKRAVVVDADIDIHDPVAVEWAIATRVQPDRDLLIVPGAQGSSLDPSRDPAQETTSKWVIDATRPMHRAPSEFLRVEPPRADSPQAETEKKV